MSNGYFSNQAISPTVVEVTTLPIVVRTSVQKIWASTIGQLPPSVLKSLLSQSELGWICPSIKAVGIRPVSKGIYRLFQTIFEKKQAALRAALQSFPVSVEQVYLSPPIDDHLAILEELLWLQCKLHLPARWVTERFIALKPSYDELRICAKKLEYDQGWAYHIHCHLQKPKK